MSPGPFLTVRSRLVPSSDVLRSLAALAVLIVAVGCGHRASEDECEEIFERSAVLALKAKNVHDPAEVKKQVEQARITKGDRLIGECRGKRITDDAMECVRRSESPAGLDACLD